MESHAGAKTAVGAVNAFLRKEPEGDRDQLEFKVQQVLKDFLALVVYQG